MNVWCVMVVSIWLLTMSIVDVRSCRIPLWLLGVGGVVTAFIGVYGCAKSGWSYLDIFGGMLPGGLLFVAGILTKLVGYGDGMVLSAVGMVVGFKDCLLILALALGLAAVCSVVLLVLGRVNRKSCIPFLPFVTMAWFLVEVI